MTDANITDNEPTKGGDPIRAQFGDLDETIELVRFVFSDPAAGTGSYQSRVNRALVERFPGHAANIFELFQAVDNNDDAAKRRAVAQVVNAMADDPSTTGDDKEHDRNWGRLARQNPSAAIALLGLGISARINHVEGVKWAPADDI